MNILKKLQILKILYGIIGSRLYNIKILVYHIVSHKHKGDDLSNIYIFIYLSP
jgi:hypothetical protein